MPSVSIRSKTALKARVPDLRHFAPNGRHPHWMRRSPRSARQLSIGPPLSALCARSWQAATTAANSAGDGGFPLASRHPRISEDALDGTAASLATHAAKLNRTKKATPRIRPPGDAFPSGTLPLRLLAINIGTTCASGMNLSLVTVARPFSPSRRQAGTHASHRRRPSPV